jgi:hypothetical protein
MKKIEMLEITWGRFPIENKHYWHRKSMSNSKNSVCTCVFEVYFLIGLFAVNPVGAYIEKSSSNLIENFSYAPTRLTIFNENAKDFL